MLKPSTFFWWMALALLQLNLCWAGNQQQEALSDSVRAGLHQAVSDFSAPEFLDLVAGQSWLKAMSPKLQKYIPDSKVSEEFLKTIHYEST